SKKKFERECREAEKAQQSYERLDNDTNATKADVEKAKQQLNLRTHMADENKNEYAAQLQNFNGEQHKHYYIVIPQIYKQLQEMDERRTIKLSECYKGFADSERKVIPIISKCLEGMILAAKSVDEHRDSQLVIDCFKSGFEPPGDFPFEDYSQNIYRTISDGTISTPKQEGMRIDSKTTVGKAKGKLWLFGKKPKPQSPPLTPTSLYTSSTPNGSQYPIFSIEPVHYCMSDIKTGKPRIPSFRSLKRGYFYLQGPALEDFSHLPPEQRRKKLQQRIDELNRELQKETDQKDALIKMKDVYEKNPQMGDPGSLQPKLTETMSNMDRLRMEIHKNEAWLSEVEGKVAARSDRRHSSDINHLVTQGRESPEGSYTDDANQEVRGPPQQHAHPNEFDDEFEDDDPLPAIGHCKAIYPFDGHNEGTLAMKEGEILYIIEEDKGDGWTRARRHNGEEGYVPTSYIDVTLEKNSKGA
ncbi:FBP1L protein, partial [Oceanites oceanicus]|nr:FBP1L protein [Oceanites oceanicus]